MASTDADMLTIADQILSNSKAGLVDLNLNQKQKVLSASTFPYLMKDYSGHFLSGTAKF